MLLPPDENMPASSQHSFVIEGNMHQVSTSFIVICLLAFVISIIATLHFCAPMGGDMKMPGGWTMSMMWMRMPGNTWMESFASFMLMWMAMMIAMMMPAALAMFLKIKKRWSFLCYTALGYFIVWILAGIPVYFLGMQLAAASMQSESLSNAVPLLFGITLILAGLYQFTPLKMTTLLHCRSAYGCAISCLQNNTGFLLGSKQGISCCICSAALMMVQLILGIMNPLIMIIVAIAITLEKLLPRPDIIVRIFGALIIIGGFVITLHWILV